MKQLVVDVPAPLSSSLSVELMELGVEAVDVSMNDERPGQVWVRGYCAESVALTTQGRAQGALDRLARRLGVAPVPRFEVRDVRSDWETHWALQLAPAHLAGGLVLVAKGVVYEAAPGERVLSLEPGLFFGFGEHPTTQLICAWIAEHCAGKKVIDVGCGTGVLSLVAAHARAASVLGIDIDVPSVESAKRNARGNDWDATCRFSSEPLERVQDQFEVVLANIDAGTLSALAGDLLRVLSPGGKLVLTGVLDEQSSVLRDRFAELGVPLCVTGERQGWVLLTNLESSSCC